MISVILTLIFHFDLTLFLLGLTVSWIFYCLGLAVSLHKYSSHRSFDAKNRLIKYVILWFGTQLAMGSTINFAAGHRQHHIKSDTPEDPYYLNHGLWHQIKLFFYWFPTHKINPLIIRDLLRDPDHQFFNNNYWRILLIYPILLLIIDPWYAVYFYALPVTYTVLGMGYVTVIAHKRLGSSPFQTGDNSWNSQLFALLLAGEGLHNTHHAFPGRYNYESQPGDIDPSGRIIEYLKI
jgi:stearoyl-CoA desaturase (delta-9 desaturase)